MHWIAQAAVRAGLPAAADLDIPRGGPAASAWDVAARTLGFAPRDLAARLAPALGVRAANLETADPHALTLLPEKLARRYQVYPLREDDRTFTVATCDPTDLEIEQAIGFASGRRTVFELAAPRDISEAINHGYSNDKAVERLLSNVDAHVADAVRVVEDSAPQAVAADEVASGPIVKLTSLILRDAIISGASDVHIEPGPKGGTVRFRIDGVMHIQMQLPMGALNRVVSRIKVLSKLDIADRIRPQDGRSRVDFEGATYDLRVSTVPTRDAEKAVIRVLRPDTVKTLDTAGLSPRELELFRSLLRVREGIVLVTGPTGSGKTTTLYGALREIAKRSVNITTVEDPIEYELPGITQMQVDAKRGVTFASALRAILRQDPDVIFVGEIRDLDTAQVATQAAMTGHLVLATLHTNDALGSVTRLNDIGLDHPSIAASLRGCVAQRLVRKVCPKCSIPVAGALTDEEQRLSSAYGTKPTIRAVGCPECGNTGYRGRLPIAEVVVITPALAELISDSASSSALQRAAAAAGMRSLLDVALERVHAGHTTLQEVERVIGDANEATPRTPDADEHDHEMAVPNNGGKPSVTPAMAATATATATPKRVATVESAPIIEGEKPAPAAPCVLVVDDDSVMRLLASTLLRGAGYRVETADDGAEALGRLLRGDEFHLVVTDLHMPVLDGAALLKAIRGRAATASLPVIVFTGSDASTEEVAAMDAGADDYIRKPIEPVRFVSRVRAALRRANLQ
ncbi:MAG TPA: ATPase, T2SS/T4P/T4SS family [Gemmatimonadaceae bacterium]|nr:ATPase, T2SS/T4P/T4SS family [Gemmatimonadaceae bacterium]